AGTPSPAFSNWETVGHSRACWAVDLGRAEAFDGVVVHQARTPTSVHGHCQLNGKSLTDAFPSRQSDGVQIAKIQRFVKEHNQQEFFLYCTHVWFLRAVDNAQ